MELKVFLKETFSCFRALYKKTMKRFLTKIVSGEIPVEKLHRGACTCYKSAKSRGRIRYKCVRAPGGNVVR